MQAAQPSTLSMAGYEEDESVVAHLKVLKDECEAAPRYGVNGRELILKAARLVARGDSKKGSAAGGAAAAAAAGQRPRAPAAQPHAEPHQQQAYCSGGLLLDAVPAAERPFAPFVARSFLTQAMRQDCVNRLMGQHLALLLQELGVASAHAVESVTKDSHIHKTAAEAALAQELRMYRDVTNKLAYQALARKTEALLKFVPEQQLAALRATHVGEASVATRAAEQRAAVPSVIGPHEQDSHQHQQSQGQHQHQQQSIPEQLHETQQASQALQHNLLQHTINATSFGADVQQAHATPYEATETDHDGQQAAKRARLTAPTCSDHPGHIPSETGDATECQLAPAPSPHQPGAADGQLQELLGDLFDDDAPREIDTHATGTSSPTMNPLQQPPLQSANRGAAAATTSSRDLAAAAPTPAMSEEQVRQQVHSFVSAVARPLLKSGVIDGRMYELVMARAVSKVLERHKGASNAGFLLKECGAITKLVTSYVEFYSASK